MSRAIDYDASLLHVFDSSAHAGEAVGESSRREKKKKKGAPLLRVCITPLFTLHVARARIFMSARLS